MRNTDRKNSPILPSDASIAKIATLLIAQQTKEEQKQKLAPVKNVLAILGAGAAISATILLPSSGRIIAPLIRQHPDWDEWKGFNPSYLRRTLRRLREQKHIEIAIENGQEIIRLTRQGKRKILRFSLDTLSIAKPKHWDKKWRLVLYDVPRKDKKMGDIIRQTLQAIGFYGIQKSIYVFPYPCFDQIEFLREYYGLGDNVQYMLVEHIEHDASYKTYFNLT